MADKETIEGLQDLGVAANLNFDKLLFLQILTISRAESGIGRFGLQDFIESVDALYSLVFPYIVDDTKAQGKLDKNQEEFSTELNKVAEADPKYKDYAQNQLYAYAKAKYRYLLEALKSNGFLPVRSGAFVED